MNLPALNLEPQPFKFTPKQLQARALCASVAKFILLYGGVRSAKTFCLITNIVDRALIAPGSRHVALRRRFTDIKSSVISDTFPKVMELCYPDVSYEINRTDWVAKFPTGSELWFGGLDDKERTEKILGNEYATILLNECSQIPYQSYLIVLTRLAQNVSYTRDGELRQLRLKMYLDENPPLRGHWTHRMFLEKKDPISKRELEEPERYEAIQMNPVDNEDNLPADFIKDLDSMPKRQRDRWRDGLFGSANENALWTDEVIAKSKVKGDELPQFVTVIVSVDPSGANEDENINNDAIGIIVVGLGTDGCAYVLEDNTIKAGPKIWGDVVRTTYDRNEADRVIGEVNFGGGMVEYVVKANRPDISYKAVTASRGKMLRAEPISALHELERIKLVGDFPDLEDEMLACTNFGYTGQQSPNRLDAFVFAVTELFPSVSGAKKPPSEHIPIPDMVRF